MGGTKSYRDLPGGFIVPPLVLDAVAAAERLGFGLSVRPEIGRLLGVLAAGLPAGALIGETERERVPDSPGAVHGPRQRQRRYR